jgi:hypothetical protein
MRQYALSPPRASFGTAENSNSRQFPSSIMRSPVPIHHRVWNPDPGSSRIIPDDMGIPSPASLAYRGGAA